MIYILKFITILILFIIPFIFIIINLDILQNKYICLIIILLFYLGSCFLLFIAFKYLIKLSIKLTYIFRCSNLKKEKAFPESQLLSDDIYEKYSNRKTTALYNLVKDYNFKEFFSIGLIGDWGSGKSSYLDGLSKQLINDDHHIVIKINVWELGNQSNVINELEKELDNQIFKNNFLIWVIQILKKILVKNYFQILKRYYISDKSMINVSLTPTITDSKEKYTNVLKKAFGDKKLIILLDELDRLDDKKEIYNIFNTIRYLTSFNNTITIIAVDLNQLSTKIDNIEYVHKIFNTKYLIPKHTKNEMATFLKERLDLMMNDSSNLLNKKHNNKSILDIISNYREIKNTCNDTLILTNTLTNQYRVEWSYYINIEFIFILNLIKAINLNVFNKIYQMENLDYSEEEILEMDSHKFEDQFNKIKNDTPVKSTKIKETLKAEYSENIETLEQILKLLILNCDINQCFYIYKYHQMESFFSTSDEYESFIEDKNKIQKKYCSLKNDDDKNKFMILLIQHCYLKKRLISNVLETILDKSIEDKEILKYLVISNSKNDTLINDNIDEILKLKNNQQILVNILELILENFHANGSRVLDIEPLFKDDSVVRLFKNLQKTYQENIIENYFIPDDLKKKLKECIK